METRSIGVPSVSGMTHAIRSAAFGGAGAFLVGLSTKIFGSGLIGGLAGIALAGSMLKGVSGEIVSTLLGFEMVNQMFNGGSAIASTGTNNGGSGFIAI